VHPPDALFFSPQVFIGVYLKKNPKILDCVTEPVILGLQGLHACQQQSCCVSQAILLVNISSLGCDFLSTSKPWLSAIRFPNFILIPLALFLYLITSDYYYIFRKYTCFPILLSLQPDYNPWPDEHMCCWFFTHCQKNPKLLPTTSHYSKQRTQVLGKSDHGLWDCMYISLSFHMC
jgi:hypothetical protein